MNAQQLGEQCAATLAGRKTGSLFTVRPIKRTELYAELRTWNQILVGKGLRIIPLRVREDTALVYLYRTEQLERDLQVPQAVRILETLGYRKNEAGGYLAQLRNRFQNESSFPHEVGLFLGYPPEDVKGFMENPRKGVKLVGVWKVYGDKELAKKKFELFRRCREYYSRHLQNGRPLEQLIVYSAA